MPPTNEPQQVNNVWATQAAQADVTWIMTLPSGQTARVKKVNVMDLLTAGIAQNFDSLTALVVEEPIASAKTALAGRKTKAPTKAEQAKAEEARLMKTVLADPAIIETMAGIADRVTVLACVEPAVALHFDPDDKTRTPIPADKRDPSKIYTDQIDFMDKVSIMSETVEDVDKLAAFRS
jgi:hypothetical protein